MNIQARGLVMTIRALSGFQLSLFNNNSDFNDSINSRQSNSLETGASQVIGLVANGE